MILSPANEAFLDLVRKLSGYQGHIKTPARSVAIVPEDGKFLVQLIDLTPDDPRRIIVVSKVVADSLDEVPAAIEEILPGGTKGGEQVLINKELEEENSYQWLPYGDSSFPMRGVRTQDWGAYRTVQ